MSRPFEVTNIADKYPNRLRRDKTRGPGNTGGNGGGDDLEARVAQLETHVQYIRRDIDSLKDDVREFRGETKTELASIHSVMRGDFRLLFGSLIAVALGLAGMMAKGFGWF